MGKELFYTNEIKISDFMKSAIQSALSFVSLSSKEFECKLIHDVQMVSIRQLRLIWHAYIYTLELYAS